MRVLVTGSAGFLGRNLVENLKCMRDGRNRTRPGLGIEEVYEYDRDGTADELDRYCADCDFVFNLAGVNRPRDPAEFAEGHVGFLSELLGALRRHGNACPVVLSSSVQATLAGRFGESAYGLSKREAERLLLRHEEETGAPAYVYRLPNLVGKWARPDYNSAVATFCHNVARDLPITVSDPSVELELLFVEDLLEELFDAMEGRPHRCRYPRAGEVAGGVAHDGLTPLPDPEGPYCYAPVTHRATLGRIVGLLREFRRQPETLTVPSIPPGSLEKKLWSMYLSYLPEGRVAYDLDMHVDRRGSFTEVLRTLDHGQVSVNVSRPGVTKGQHWHNSKWELFVVVSGRALIRERRIGSDEVVEFEVSGERMRAVRMLPGWTHEIVNLSDTQDLVTLMWANEPFDPERPDTFFEPV